ncbi:amino acid ABC transporter permease [Companilactobacillus insicii]|uniref:amino acid ABC transporter permease n=1 Tax=Companilactobacillus insicii TaxID=1732567 RepID=UPI001FE6D795|nr:amino acid ABC transporter permease [Companilactobacillus insicii]
MVKSIPYILLGLPYTLGLSLLTFILGNILGILITALGMIPNKIVKKIVRIYISFIRGVPALVILFILYFGLPYQLSALTATIICFTLTSSAFISEIYRGAISGVDAGQWDAAYTLDLDFSTTMIKVVLPQAIRISIPSLGNVAMDLLKGTSLAAMITIPDIFQRAKIVGGRSFDYMSMYILVALIYWSLCILIELIQKRIEKRANYN